MACLEQGNNEAAPPYGADVKATEIMCCCECVGTVTWDPQSARMCRPCPFPLLALVSLLARGASGLDQSARPDPRSLHCAWKGRAFKV